MKRFSLLVICSAILATATLMPARSEARVFVGIGLGGGCCYYGPGWGYPYYGYYYPPAYSSYYTPYAPPVAAAPPSTTIIYNTPPATAPASVMATQTSTTFTDSFGRTCRHFQTSAGGAPATGTACMQTDGTWQVTQ